MKRVYPPGIRPRRCTFRIYPNKAQEKRLLDVKGLHQRIYNLALQERIEAYQEHGRTVTFLEQARRIKEIRQNSGDYWRISFDAMRETFRRLDRAYKAFFRRVKKGNVAPGFPKSKGFFRYPGWTYPSLSGWNLYFSTGSKKTFLLYLQELGKSDWDNLRLRGSMRVLGVPRTLTILHRHGQWYASVVFDCRLDDLKRKPRKKRKPIGLDWGVASFATLSDGRKIENPRHLRSEQAKIKKLQRAMSRKKKGSGQWKRAKGELGKRHRKVANRRTDFLHKTSARLVREADLIATEQLSVKNLTGSAKGTVEKPGKNVKAKAGLNEAILDTSPARFQKMLEYKSEEADTTYIEVDTKTVKPSQTCPKCGRQAKKKLSERVHKCECGLVMDRDQAAALVCLQEALKNRKSA